MHLSRKVLRYILYQLLQDRALKSCYTQSEHCLITSRTNLYYLKKNLTTTSLWIILTKALKFLLTKSVYVVNGPKIDKMLGYTNLESEKGFDFFQKFMKRSGVLDELEKLGIEEGDTVIVGDYLEFDYYKA